MKKNYLYKLLLFSFFFCLQLSTVFAQETGTISGKILDNKGEPMIGALVRVEGTEQGTQTDLEGNFTIANVKAGEHSVLVKSIGFAPLKQKVTVKAGETASLGSPKMAESSQQLKEVVVVGYGSSIK